MAKKISLWLGIVFVAVFLASLVENPLVGENALLVTNFNHDLVHLLTGVVLILLGMSSAANAKTGLKVFGVVYALVAVLGFAMIPQGGSLLGLLDMSAADHYFHALLALVILYLGFSKSTA